MKIAVAGMGYVGLSLATLLSQENEVVAVDIDEKRVEKVNKRIPPIEDKKIAEYFTNKELNLKATLDYSEALDGAEYIIICTPTNYDVESGMFDTSSVEAVIDTVIESGVDTTIVIKSTIPVGYIDSIKKEKGIKNIFFSPEFLREGKALEDNLYPSRIVVGDESEAAVKFGELLKKSALSDDVEVIYMQSTEAEAVKLFANTYLAMRVSYFNELDTFAEMKNLDSKKIIEAICLDPRIGKNYCNPSFGYGGYCLPKDTKQLRQNYEEKNIPQKMIEATVQANDIRKRHIANSIIEMKPKCVGIYRLTMKRHSDNFRESAIQEIIRILKAESIDVIIYEPALDEDTFNDCAVINSFDSFVAMSDIILANRLATELEPVMDKVYSRDVFRAD